MCMYIYMCIYICIYLHTYNIRSASLLLRARAPDRKGSATVAGSRCSWRLNSAAQNTFRV